MSIKAPGQEEPLAHRLSGGLAQWHRGRAKHSRRVFRNYRGQLQVPNSNFLDRELMEARWLHQEAAILAVFLLIVSNPPPAQI